jgi:hypothetical protein
LLLLWTLALKSSIISIALSQGKSFDVGECEEGLIENEYVKWYGSDELVVEPTNSA